MRKIFEYTFPHHCDKDKHRITTWGNVWAAACGQYPGEPVIARKVVVIMEDGELAGKLAGIGNEYATVAAQVKGDTEARLEYDGGCWVVSQRGPVNQSLSYVSLYRAFQAWACLVQLPFNPMVLVEVRVSENGSSFEPVDAATPTVKPKPERPETFGAWS